MPYGTQCFTYGSPIRFNSQLWDGGRLASYSFSHVSKFICCIIRKENRLPRNVKEEKKNFFMQNLSV